MTWTKSMHTHPSMEDLKEDPKRYDAYGVGKWCRCIILYANLWFFAYMLSVKMEKGEVGWTSKLVTTLENDPLKPLSHALECRGLLTERYYHHYREIKERKERCPIFLSEFSWWPRIKEELKLGEEYWALERKLCHALTAQEDVNITIQFILVYILSKIFVLKLPK